MGTVSDDDEPLTSEFPIDPIGGGLLQPIPACESTAWEDLRKIAAAEIAAGIVDKAKRTGEHLTQCDAELAAEREMRRLDQEFRRKSLVRGKWPTA